jgi:hypothetical protein
MEPIAKPRFPSQLAIPVAIPITLTRTSRIIEIAATATAITVPSRSLCCGYPAAFAAFVRGSNVEKRMPHMTAKATSPTMVIKWDSLNAFPVIHPQQHLRRDMTELKRRASTAKAVIATQKRSPLHTFDDVPGSSRHLAEKFTPCEGLFAFTDTLAC